MKVEITCTENFQQVRFVAEVQYMEEISTLIASVRQAIKDGTTDVEGSKKKAPAKKKTAEKPVEKKVEQPVQEAPEDSMPVTQGQRNYLRSLGVAQDKIDALRSFNEASKLISQLSGTKLRKNINN